MKYRYLCLTFLLLSFLFARCSKEKVDPRAFPSIATLEVTNVSKEGATFNAEVEIRGNHKILEYGFVWSEFSNPRLESSDKIFYSEGIVKNRFSGTISTTLKAGSRYYVKSFLKTEAHTVYGKEVEFTSLGSKAPQITSFAPVKGAWGDTIKVYGKNFSFVKSKNVVHFGSVKAEVLVAADTLLIVKVPGVKNDLTTLITVSLTGNITTAQEKFTYLIPELHAITPLKGSFDDTISVSGKNFSSDTQLNTVLFNNVSAQVVYASPGLLKVLVPPALTVKTSLIKVLSGGKTFEYNQAFELNSFNITGISPDTAFKPNEIITILGENFSPSLTNNRVWIGTLRAEVVEATTKYIKVILPNGIIPTYNMSTFGKYSIQVTVADLTKIGPGLEVCWRSTWTRKKVFPGNPRIAAVAFSLNNKGYFGTGVVGNERNQTLLNDFWEYDPASDTWTKIADFPGIARAGATAFTANNRAYVGLGSNRFYQSSDYPDKDHFKDFYSFNPNTKTWTKVADFPGVGRHSALGFAIDNNGYVGTGWLGTNTPTGEAQSANDIWRYNSSSNTWSEERQFIKHTSSAVGVSFKGEAYVYDFDAMYKLTGNGWVQQEAPKTYASQNAAFAIKDNIYIGLGFKNRSIGTSELWEYNPATKKSVNRDISPYAMHSVSSFVINNKAYVVGGASFGTFLITVWEFDPSLPKL